MDEEIPLKAGERGETETAALVRPSNTTGCASKEGGELWQQTHRRLTVTSVTAEGGANGLNALKNRTNTNEN